MSRWVSTVVPNEEQAKGGVCVISRAFVFIVTTMRSILAL